MERGGQTGAQCAHVTHPSNASERRASTQSDNDANGATQKALPEGLNTTLREVLMLTRQLVAAVVAASALILPAWQTSPQITGGGVKSPPTVTAAEAPSGSEALPVQWLRVAVANLGVMRAAVARPSGAGPFPAVLILHGTHGFARQYVELANDFARSGFIAVAA